jgi:hypothetical protein
MPERLIPALGDLRAEVHGFRTAVKVIAVLLLIGLLAVGLLSVTALSAADSAASNADTVADAVAEVRAAVTEMAEQRTTGKVTNCNTTNETALKINGLNDQIQSILSNILAGTTRPDAIAFLNDQIAGLAGIEVPYRDCSDAGIAAYDASGGTDGYLPPGVDP